MNAWLAWVWVLCLIATPAAHAGSAADWFSLATCRTGDRLVVSSAIAQDEGGLRCELTRYTFKDGATTVEPLSAECLQVGAPSPLDGGAAWPALDANGVVTWSDPACRPLRRVALRLDVRVVPARPTRSRLESAAGVPLRTSDFWREPLRRRVNVLGAGRVVGAFDVELQAPEIRLDGYDVGDRRHVLVAARWTFAHHEGAPVNDLGVQLVELDGSRLPPAGDDGGTQVVRGFDTLTAAERWREIARWQDAMAKGLEAMRAPQAIEARALATRRARQAALVGRRQFTAVLEACNRVAAASDDRSKRATLVEAVLALHAVTRPAEWPLAVEALDWSWSTCGDVVHADAAGAAWADGFSR